jgi:outer membrane biosynthesis protein TonB
MKSIQLILTLALCFAALDVHAAQLARNRKIIKAKTRKLKIKKTEPPKEPKKTKSPKKTKAPKKEATPAPTNAVTSAPTKAKLANFVPPTPAPSTTSPTPSPTTTLMPSVFPTLVPTFLPQNCTIDEDCNHNDYYCAMNTTCCKWNVTCHIGAAMPTSGAESLSISSFKLGVSVACGFIVFALA